MTTTTTSIAGGTIVASALTSASVFTLPPPPVTLAITRGYPGSGKTTLARKWVAEDPGRRAYVSRDDLRGMHWEEFRGLGDAREVAVGHELEAMVRVLLGRGMSVIVDATHLRLRDARNWATLAVELGVEFKVIDVKTTPDECIARDAARGATGGRLVGHARIRQFADRWAKPFVPVEPYEATDEHHYVTPYVARPDLPDAYIIDIDGTMARKKMGEGSRGWHDYTRVSEDTPIADVIALVQALWFSGFIGGRRRPQIIVLSGREDSCYTDTRAWLDEHLGENLYDELYMRATGDHRDDSIIKSEMFDAHVRHRFNVRGVVDDRPRVCRMWRAMGLTTFQVGDPAVEF